MATRVRLVPGFASDLYEAGPMRAVAVVESGFRIVGLLCASLRRLLFGSFFWKLRCFSSAIQEVL